MKQILLLFTAAAAVSPASIFILLAGAPSMSVAFYRMVVSSLILLPFFLYRSYKKSITPLTGRDAILTIIAGLCLSAHFATWVTSLFYTPVANSVILVTTQPIYVAILGWIFLKEKLGYKGIIGIIVAVSGAIVIAGGDFNLSSEYMLGDILAIIGAIMAASYFTIGRQVRKKVHLLTYIFYCYTISAIGLLPVVLIFSQPLHGFSGMTWLYFFLLGLIPTVIGHSLYNWALKYLRAFWVGVCILGEPIGATLLAWIVLDQKPTFFFYIGAALIGVGLLVLFSTEKVESAPA